MVRSDLVRVFLFALNGKCDLKLANKTLISLITKVDKLKKIADFWPISLCSIV